MASVLRWLASAALSLAAASTLAAPLQGLQVRLSAPTPVLYGDTDVAITVSVTNTTRHPVHVLRWQLPDEEVETSLFKITRENGERVRYTGPLVKRAEPQPSDFVRIDAGATLDYSVELTAAYDLSRSGRYAIEYAARGTHNKQRGSLHSDTLYLWLEGRSQKSSVSAPPASMAAAAPTYNACSTTQQTQLSAAVAQAVTYAAGAVSYLNSINSGTQRYTKWFGVHTSAREATALDHFQKVHSAFTTQNLSFDCKCKKRGTYAFVYPNQPYKIYLCGAFWSAPLAGTDSRGGTLIHEMTHFTVVAGTADHAYGQTNAAALAISDPDLALNNADSHEYFAENTPALP